MLVADSVLEPVPGPQERERSANCARLDSLYRAWGRPHQAAAQR